MSAVRRGPSSPPPRFREVAELRVRLAEAEQTLHAIRSGGVDAVVVAGKEGAQVFTLEGADHAYRVLIESMNEGALTLAADATILYSNQRFATMVDSPLEQVTGTSFRRYLSREHWAKVRPLLKRAGPAGAQTQVFLIARDGSQTPAQVSSRPLPQNGSSRATTGVVVTNMTDARRSEDMLRALSRRLVQAHEVERRRVALELHDHITQLLCALLFRLRALTATLSKRDEASKVEAAALNEMLTKAAEEVQRISRDLRPSLLDELGLVGVLHAAAADFAKRTNVSIRVDDGGLTARLPADTELTLYRILQEALTNVEKHAHARHVIVSLRHGRTFVQLSISDDGVGYEPDHRPVSRTGDGGLGLLGMRERATYVGGIITINTRRPGGTDIVVRVPLPRHATATNRTDSRSA